MRHLAAYLLLKLGGNDSPSADDITKALGSVGVEVDSDSLSKLMGELEGKDLNEILATGKEMLATFGGGGGGGGGGGAAAGGDAAGDAAPAVEEVEEEMDMGGGMDVFGGGGGGGDY
jgi:ribosomal protein L12E/L44/L45/RPP1/RPP2